MIEISRNDEYHSTIKIDVENNSPILRLFHVSKLHFWGQPYQERIDFHNTMERILLSEPGECEPFLTLFNTHAK